jgi:radical SAM superfamily enzyme YgiQ (UPF0313 family)
MRVSLSTSLHLDHSKISFDERPGDPPPMQAFVPVGLLSLKAAADRDGVDANVEVVEVNALINRGAIRNTDQFYDDLVDTILEKGDDLAGFMTDADSLPHTILTAQRLRHRSPHTAIVLGGPAASPISKLLMERFPFIDFVARGEAELTFVELLECLGERRKPAGVLGLTWRDGDAAVANGDRPLIADVDELPVPAYASFDMAAGAPLYLDVGRGCPFRCRFCATAPFWNRTYRMKSNERIVQETTMVRDRFARTHVNFSHDIFTCDRKWTAAFCQMLIAERVGMTWSCSTRTDIIDEDLLAAMAAAGCVEIYYGIETGSDTIQKDIDKGLDLGRSREIVRATVAAGIRPVTGFIVGHPTETLETLGDTMRHFFDFLHLGGVRAHLFPLCPFHESPMFRQHASTIDRAAECTNVPLCEPLAEEYEQFQTAHRDVFASNFRYATPSVPRQLIDACEGLSCHLVTLKSLWPLLLPCYESALDWLRRWVDWIEAYNATARPGTRLAHQGNAWDLLRFLDEELVRLGLADSDIADLVHYESAKLSTLGLSAYPSPVLAKAVGGPGVVRHRCNFIIEEFRHDLRPLLSGLRAGRTTPDDPSFVVFAKTGDATIDTLSVGRSGKILLELAGRPQSVESLLEQLHSVTGTDDGAGLQLLRQLCRRGILCES